MKRQKDKKRNFDSLVEVTGNIRRRTERADQVVVIATDVRAYTQVDGEMIALGPPFFPFAGKNCVGVVPLHGGSIDTDCGDGDEHCEEVPGEQHRRRRAKSGECVELLGDSLHESLNLLYACRLFVQVDDCVHPGQKITKGHPLPGRTANNGTVARLNPTPPGPSREGKTQDDHR